MNEWEIRYGYQQLAVKDWKSPALSPDATVR